MFQFKFLQTGSVCVEYFVVENTNLESGCDLVSPLPITNKRLIELSQSYYMLSCFDR